MNRRTMPRLTALFMPLALLACQPAAEEPPLAGATIGGEFTLVDQAGKSRTWADFRGRYAMVYFGYTYCPDICPTDMQRAAQGLRQFASEDPERAAKVQHIFVTVDPERDTQAVVGEFASAFGKDIVALTGTREQVDAAAKAFRIYHGKGTVEEGGAYLVDHSNIVYLFGPDGAPIATLPADQGAEAVARELDRWVR
ncbi:SCO family protein [Tsuneonella troitsensis]|uniref:SCO family protein n=1 Tax=Tsuneonella troitsensis TaxID=292222 RepID=UPI00070F2D5E|nr:SCO family protein [Tsuneonella troitsensis]